MSSVKGFGKKYSLIEEETQDIGYCAHCGEPVTYGIYTEGRKYFLGYHCTSKKCGSIKGTVYYISIAASQEQIAERWLDEFEKEFNLESTAYSEEYYAALGY